ncbi:MAG TPA: hypothetical protein VF230_14805 [Acidimicrobiales bacterium]
MNPNRPHFAPWDEREWPRLLTAEEGARRVRIFHAVERRQSELLAQWAETVTEPHLQTTLKRHARHAEWHGILWHHALADSDGEEADDAPASSFLDAVADVKGADQTIEFLTGIYRVLVPRKVTAYTYYQRAIGTQDSDADWRWIDFILKDELDAIRDGELSLQSLLTSADDVERSARRRAELEARMVENGGLVGPDTLGMAQAKA